MKKGFLPSKKFIFRSVAIISVIIIVFSVRYIILFFVNKPKSNIPQKVLVKEIIQKDNNENGIADWEESLWGLNPDKDGESNREFILNKKRELAQKLGSTTPGSISNKPITENEQLSRDLFALIMALEESGELNEGTINSVSEIIGEKIEISLIEDRYVYNELNVVEETKVNLTLYFDIFEILNERYVDADIGQEVAIVGQGLANNDPSAFEVIKNIASSYRSFGEDLMKMPVPTNITSMHLSLANNYEKTAQSIEEMAKILQDPIAGMRGFVSYKKYSDNIVSDIERLSSNL